MADEDAPGRAEATEKTSVVGADRRGPATDAGPGDMKLLELLQAADLSFAKNQKFPEFCEYAKDVIVNGLSAMLEDEFKEELLGYRLPKGHIASILHKVKGQISFKAAAAGAASGTAAGAAPDDANIRKLKFETLVYESGTTPDRKVVDRVFLDTVAQANACTSADVAKKLYEMAKHVLTTTTRLELRAHGIDLDGLVPGAYSSKAVLQVIAMDGRISVFKYPTHEVHLESILKDFRFCDAIKAKNLDKLPSGLVSYTDFSLKVADGRKIRGSLSNMYAFSLNKWNMPLSCEFIVAILHRLTCTLESVHHLGFVVVDLKLDNIFMTRKCLADIGDFGGACKIGEPITEYTPEYILEDNEGTPPTVATAAVDWGCLVNIALMLMKLQQCKSTKFLQDSLAAIPPGYKAVGDILALVVARLLPAAAPELNLDASVARAGQAMTNPSDALMPMVDLESAVPQTSVTHGGDDVLVGNELFDSGEDVSDSDGDN